MLAFIVDRRFRYNNMLHLSSRPTTLQRAHVMPTDLLARMTQPTKVDVASKLHGQQLDF